MPEISNYFTYNSSVDTTGYLRGQVSYTVYGKKYELSVTVRNLINKYYTTVGNVKKGRYAIGVSVWTKSDTPVWLD